jgi:hypothetical protein
MYRMCEGMYCERAVLVLRVVFTRGICRLHATGRFDFALGGPLH